MNKVYSVLYWVVAILYAITIPIYVTLHSITESHLRDLGFFVELFSVKWKEEVEHLKDGIAFAKELWTSGE